MEDLRSLLSGYPEAVSVSAADVTAGATGAVFIVLDDDPTGTQSVAGLPVLTSWGEADFAWALSTGAPAIYVLTNSRSLAGADAARINREVVANAQAAATAQGARLAFVSRSDSTLRGHFPLETDVLAEAMQDAGLRAPDAVILVPAFPDANRITIGAVHYMRSGSELQPIAETEFARDATFGYANSNLAAYVEEKTNGRINAADVITLTLDVLRGGAGKIAAALAGASNAIPVVADAVSEDDLRLLALGLQRAEADGKSFLYRVGPPFVRAAIGQEQHPPLSAEDVYGDEPVGRSRGGLIVVGSHVGVTTRQLNHLQEVRPPSLTVEIDVASVIDPAVREQHLAEVSAQVASGLNTGDVVLHTSRQLVTAATGEESLDISRRVSAAVVDVVQRVLAAAPPRFVIAKGGITSSDVASKGLQIGRAIVRGPMLPGIVSLWEPMDGPAEGIPYIVFAGNVGDDSSLAAVVDILSEQ